jgi:chromosome segregation ATPase
MQEENKNLRKLRAKAGQADETSEKLAAMTEENESNKQQVTRLQDTLTKTKKQLEDAKNRSRTLELQVIETQKLLDEKEEENKRLAEAKRKAEKELKSYEDMPTRKPNRASGNMGESLENLNLTAELQAHSDETAKELKDQIEALQAQCDSLEAQYEAMKAKYEEERNRRLEISKQLDEATESVSTLTEKLANSEKMCQQLRNENMKKASVVEGSTSEKDAEELQKLAAQVKQLKRKLLEAENLRDAHKTQAQQERQLLLTHFYNVAFKMHPVRPSAHGQQQQQQQVQRQQQVAPPPKS